MYNNRWAILSLWERLPWQKPKTESNNKNSKNYEDDAIVQGSVDVEKKIQIIIDDPAEEDALDFQRYSQNLANIIRATKPKFAVGIFGKWGTGKTTLMRMIEKELDKDSEKILTVWFDAWRYEREKYLAIIPFLRQIKITLEKERTKNKKSTRWDIVRDGLEKTFTAFIESTDLSIAAVGSPASASISLQRFISSFKSKGSAHIEGEQLQFHEHVTDYLKNALDVLERQNPGSRIVVFVDDLDRCTPEKALEVLESIKAFFDIEGIVYVIGMDSDSIDHIVEQKYGKDSKIKGIDYLQKIVQLPFQIPIWKPEDISGSLDKIISKGLEDSELVYQFKRDDRKSLIVKAIEPNPRQVKRFINNIILAKAVFGEDVDYDKLIAVQALNFRREWNRFLELIAEDDNTRKTFFEEYYLPPQGKGKSIRNKDALDNFIKEQSEANSPLPKEIIDIFQELLINQEDDTLKSFLDDSGAAEILRDIDEMEKYRRALEATKFKEEREQTGYQGSTGLESAFDRAKRIADVLQGAHILWVDDHPENNIAERKILDSFGMSVDIARSTNEAILKLTQEKSDTGQRYDVIISDMGRGLKRDEGKQFLTRIRRDHKIDVPVIYYVGKYNPKDGVPPYAFGMTNRPEQLLLYIMDALERQRS